MIKVDKKAFILCFAAFIFAIMSGGNLPYTVFYLTLSVIIFGTINLFIHKKFIQIRVKSDKEVFKVGETIEFATIVSSSNLVPPSYVALRSKVLNKYYKNYEGDIINLLPMANKWLKKKLSFTSRGVYDLGEMNIEIGDAFGIAKVNFENKSSFPVKVYPKIYSINEEVFSAANILESEIKEFAINEDTSDIRNIRKYIEGDNIKRINWKVSAKFNNIYVREFERLTGNECRIFINMSESNYFGINGEEKEEFMVDSFISIVSFLIEKGIKCGIEIFSSERKSFSINNSEGLKELVEILINTKSDEVGVEVEAKENSFIDYLTYKVQNSSTNAFNIIVTMSVDDLLVDFTKTLNNLGYKTLIFFINDLTDGKDNGESIDLNTLIIK